MRTSQRHECLLTHMHYWIIGNFLVFVAWVGPASIYWRQMQTTGNWDTAHTEGRVITTISSVTH